MLFVINNLKYDTDKMKLVSDKCEYNYGAQLFGVGVPLYYRGKDVKLWKSNKGNYLLTYSTDYKSVGRPLTEEEAKRLLMKYDLGKYEILFGELEEA